jgi:hypothetical protein
MKYEIYYNITLNKMIKTFRQRLKHNIILDIDEQLILLRGLGFPLGMLVLYIHDLIVRKL